MKKHKSIVKNGLLSVLVHGMVLLGCCAYCAGFQHGLVPYFSAGDSALTLTSLSVGRDGSAGLSVHAKPPPRRDNAAELMDEEADQVEQVIAEEADVADDLPVAGSDLRENRELLISREKPADNDDKRTEAKQPGCINADNRNKGVIGGFTPTASQFHPHYPLRSRLRGEEGTVKVEAVVGPGGRALRLTIIESSGFPALDAAALDAVKRARFGSSGGLPPAKEITTTLKFRFDLTD